MRTRTIHLRADQASAPVPQWHHGLHLSGEIDSVGKLAERIGGLERSPDGRVVREIPRAINPIERPVKAQTHTIEIRQSRSLMAG